MGSLWRMAIPGKGHAAPWIAKRVADWLDWLGSQTATLKCNNEPAILALAQEIRRLRRESSITVLEHPEEGEKESVNNVKGPHQNLEEQHGPEFPNRDWPVSSADTMDH